MKDALPDPEAVSITQLRVIKSVLEYEYGSEESFVCVIRSMLCVHHHFRDNNHATINSNAAAPPKKQRSLFR